jgi:hypothetical protein
MVNSCPKGVICIENFTLSISVIIIIMVVYLIYFNYKTSKKEIPIKEIERYPIINITEPKTTAIARPNTVYTTISDDILTNPYTPPLKNPVYDDIIENRINTSVNYMGAEYRQLGILIPENDNYNSLALLGRPLYRNRTKWQYYTINDKRNSLKLPIYYKKRNCTNEYGCDELYTNDVVLVEGINTLFKVSLYENETFWN